MPRFSPSKVGLVLVSIALFVFALELMKAGARGAAPLFRDWIRVEDPIDALGIGWLFAYVVLSGSPVAAAGLTFLDSNVLSPLETYAMIAGSRVGASMVVVLLGFLYIVRGKQSRQGLATGLLAMVVTATIYVPALLLGLVVLQFEVLPDLQFSVPLLDVVDLAYAPAVDMASAALPDAGLFVLGVAVMVGSFSLFDRGLPTGGLESADLRERAVYRPIVMFLFGLAVTTLTLSVSVSIGLLVPLSARGLVRRENVVPYVMGCNVSTFIDTLFVALLLQTPKGFTVVVIEMASVAAVSIVVLTIGFATYQRYVDRIVDWALDTDRNLAVFLAVLFLVPLVLVVR